MGTLSSESVPIALNEQYKMLFFIHDILTQGLDWDIIAGNVMGVVLN